MATTLLANVQIFEQVLLRVVCTGNFRTIILRVK